MSPSEYQELVEFLGHRFGAIDRQFAAVDRQFGELRGDLGALRGDLAGLRTEMLDRGAVLQARIDEVERRLRS